MNQDLAQRAIDEAFVAHVHDLFKILATSYSPGGTGDALARFQTGFQMALEAHAAATRSFGNGSPQT